jgi:cholesterol transport system auxiliary component
VTTPTALPGYATSRMIYEKTPYQLSAFASHRWISPPTSLLLPLIIDQLRAYHYFHAIVTAPFSGTVNYQLNTTLIMLKQEFLTPQSDVRLVIEASLIDGTTGNVIASRVFQTVVPAESNPYSGVAATNRAMHIVLNRIAKFVIANTTPNS